VNEFGSKAFYTGNGPNELLIIPNARPEAYNLQLVGIGGGNFVAGLNFVSTAGTQSIVVKSTVLDGSLSVNLDFSKATQLPASNLALGPQQVLTSGSLASSSPGLTIVQTAFANDAAVAMIRLLDNQSASLAAGGGEVVTDLVLRPKLSTLVKSTAGRALKSLAASLRLPFGNEEAATDEAAPREQQIFDLFWESVGHRLIGLPGDAYEAFQLDELFQQFRPPDQLPVQQPQPNAPVDEGQG
jgi:hypothetical protein